MHFKGHILTNLVHLPHFIHFCPHLIILLQWEYVTVSVAMPDHALTWLTEIELMELDLIVRQIAIIFYYRDGLYLILIIIE